NGNPLYIACVVEELKRSRTADLNADTAREIVPDTIQQMFERQAAQLTESEQAMLDTAAVTGWSFPIPTIATALGRDAAQGEVLCEALARRHLIRKRAPAVRFPDGTESPAYSFLHALCRDALYRRIPAGRRLASRLVGSGRGTALRR